MSSENPEAKTVLLLVILGKQGISPLRDVLEFRIVVFNFQTQLSNVIPQLIKISAIIRLFKIPNGKIP